MTHSSKIGVVGAGAYGTAMANHLSLSGHEVTIWAREEEVLLDINTHHENKTYLADLPLSKTLKASGDLASVVQKKEVVVCAVPSQFLRSVLKEVRTFLSDETIIVNVAKGIETATSKLISEVYEEILPKKMHSQLAFLSGPSFAKELAQEHPTAVALGSREGAVGVVVQELFQGDAFFLDWTNDYKGVVLGGAVKNVIAIACGLADGLGFGHSTRAMFMTRGLHEMIDLGKKLGASPQTFHGLSGVGDLIVTCMGGLSRNKTVGIEIAKGKTIEMIRKETKSVAEGVETSKAIHKLSQSVGVKLPICEKVYQILHEGKPAKLIFS
jgi:glycerol-3-phosphate dehydrogenase (NAD(P)+)